MARIRKTPVDPVERFKFLFHSKYVKSADGCWNWTGSRPLTKDGRRWYGRLIYNYKFVSSHRASWIIFYGEIPNGMMVCHKCDNPACVNPEHLFLGTPRDNVLDCISKNRTHYVGSKKGKKQRKWTFEERERRRKVKQSDRYLIKALSILGMTQRNIARNIGTTPSNVQNILHRDFS